MHYAGGVGLDGREEAGGQRGVDAFEELQEGLPPAMKEAILSRPHEAVVGDQFGPRAQAYVESAVHAAGADLDALDVIVGAAKPARALDLGAGGGHVAYLMARHAAMVTACDLSADMLNAVAGAAR